MADCGPEKCDENETLAEKHKRECKMLQAEAQKMKHSVTKGDKKKKKSVNEKIALLEAELDARHEKELADNNTQAEKLSVSAVEDSLQQLSTGDNQEIKSEKTKKPSKAQKKREKKAAENLDREAILREQEIDNLTSSRHLEALNIKKKLNERGLQIFPIPSDGNCLYAAVSHQLKQRNIEKCNDTLRKQVSEYMREHQDDFMPFLTKDNGDCYSQDDFTSYCDEIENTPAWGGQLEIQALSNILRIPVEVVQSEGPPIVTGQEHGNQPILLTYYRHAYGLGEHYHSVEVKTEDQEDEFT